MKKAAKTSVKKATKKNTKSVTKSAVDSITNYASDLDYKKITQNALKIAVPLVMLKMLHSKYQDSKKHPWEKAAGPLLKEIKSKLKKM